MMGTIGRALIAEPVAIAAETPQIEIPLASAPTLAAEFEILAGDEIDQRPVDQIRFYNRAQPAEHYRCCQSELFGGGHAEKSAENHDSGFDVQLRTDSLAHRLTEAGAKLPINRPTTRATMYPASAVRLSDQPSPNDANWLGVAAILAHPPIIQQT